MTKKIFKYMESVILFSLIGGFTAILLLFTVITEMFN